MKKILSVFLAVLMVLSVFTMTLSASAEDTIPTYTIIFVDADGTVLSTLELEEGSIVKAPENPTKASTDTTEYTFKGWNDGTSDVLYHPSTIPVATQDITYIAVYSENDTSDNITFMQIVRNFFARINVLFEYFYRLFVRPTDNAD